MWRSTAILLAMLFSWTLIAPALAPSAEANVPACCRKSGKHECAMHVKAAGNVISGVSAKCPCCPQKTVPAQWESFKPCDRQVVVAGWVRRPSISAEAEAGFRISFHRSRQKRGPPSA